MNQSHFQAQRVRLSPHRHSAQWPVPGFPSSAYAVKPMKRPCPPSHSPRSRNTSRTCKSAFNGGFWECTAQAVLLPQLATFDYCVVNRTLSGAALALVLRCDLLGDAGLENDSDFAKRQKLKIPGFRPGISRVHKRTYYDSPVVRVFDWQILKIITYILLLQVFMSRRFSSKMVEAEDYLM